MQVLTGYQGLTLRNNMRTPSIMTGVVHTSRGHLFQMFVSKRCSYSADKSTLRGFFLSDSHFLLQRSVLQNPVKIYLNYLKMSPSFEILYNDLKLSNEWIDPAQLSKKLPKYSHKKNKIFPLYTCVFEEYNQTMSMSAVNL